MQTIALLWLPILVTAVLIFVSSSLIHMVFKWHNSDYRKLPNEDDVRAAIRAGAPTPGTYVVPHCQDMKDLGSDAMQQKFKEGPVAFLTLKTPGPPSMGRPLLLWFLSSVVIAAIAGCLALCAFPPGKVHAGSAGFLVGTTSLLAYACGSVHMGIWMAKPWSSVAKDVLDSIIYAAVSGGVFMWLWP